MGRGSGGVPGELFKALAGALPTGVTVVTSLDAAGRPAGLTAGAVCGLSRTPPLLLICLGNTSRTLTALLHHGTFCVHVLDASAAPLAARFASPGDDKFAGTDWHPGPGGVPVLDSGIAARAVCEVRRTVDGGDHTVVIALVVDGQHLPEAVPLLYHRRQYAPFGRPG